VLVRVSVYWQMSELQPFPSASCGVLSTGVHIERTRSVEQSNATETPNTYACALKDALEATFKTT
jgi:hypothetical protein